MQGFGPKIVDQRCKEANKKRSRGGFIVGLLFAAKSGIFVFFFEVRYIIRKKQQIRQDGLEKKRI